LTKRIVERNYKGDKKFEFVNLNSYENDMYFTSDILEYELDAEFIDVYHGLDLFFRILKKDGIKFKVLEDYIDGLCLTLLEQNKKDNNWLRNLANEVLNIIRTKGSKYLTKKARKKRKEKFLSDSQYFEEKWKDAK